MKNKNFIFILAIAVVTVLGGCKARLVDFTVISTKNVQLGNTKGERVRGKSMMFAGIGTDIKSAIDNALERAGDGSDMLVDGVVKQVSYWIFWAGFEVDGTAVNSTKLRASLGEAGFDKWCKEHNIITPQNPGPIVPADKA